MSKSKIIPQKQIEQRVIRDTKLIGRITEARTCITNAATQSETCQSSMLDTLIQKQGCHPFWCLTKIITNLGSRIGSGNFGVTSSAGKDDRHIPGQIGLPLQFQSTDAPLSCLYKACGCATQTTSGIGSGHVILGNLVAPKRDVDAFPVLIANTAFVLIASRWLEWFAIHRC